MNRPLSLIVSLVCVFAVHGAQAKSPADGLTANPAGRVAVAFLDMVFNQKKVDEAFGTYVGNTYVQHNPGVPDGVEGGRNGLKGLLGKLPQIRYDFKRVVVEGEMVVVHSHVRLSDNESDRGEAVVDIYRVQDGKLVEHWDVIQAVPATAANRNTMF